MALEKDSEVCRQTWADKGYEVYRRKQTRPTLCGRTIRAFAWFQWSCHIQTSWSV